jgi:hypothetical protein
MITAQVKPEIDIHQYGCESRKAVATVTAATATTATATVAQADDERTWAKKRPQARHRFRRVQATWTGHGVIHVP